MQGVLGGNLMRIMDKVDAVAESMQDKAPSSAIWEARTDLPATKWGGGGIDVYWPRDVKTAVQQIVVHDEL
jgi:membrane dipeptidase